jgi:hypothetical protein
MERFHYWFMGLVTVLYGMLVVLDYAAVQYRIPAYLDAFTPAQQAWFTSLPAWVDGVWGAQTVLALAGGIALVLMRRAAVWLLGFSFITNGVLCLWMLVLASPSMVTVTGWAGCAILTGSLLLTLLFWLYARGERQALAGIL